MNKYHVLPNNTMLHDTGLSKQLCRGCGMLALPLKAMFILMRLEAQLRYFDIQVPGVCIYIIMYLGATYRYVDVQGSRRSVRDLRDGSLGPKQKPVPWALEQAPLSNYSRVFMQKVTYLCIRKHNIDMLMLRVSEGVRAT